MAIPARATFLVALIGVVLLCCGFLTGIVPVLDESEQLRGFWQVVFFAAAIAVLAAIVASIVAS